jgi:hypothetical protein
MKPMTHEEAELLVVKYAHAPFALIRAVESYHGLFDERPIAKPPISFTHDENGCERN